MIYFGSVIFNSNMKFFKEFLESLERQTYKNFELLLVNDNVKRQDLDNIISFFPKISEKIIIIETTGELKPYELRILMLKEAKKREGVLLILGDSDDIFDSNRILNIVKAHNLYSEYTFFYNDFVLQDGKKLMGPLPLYTNEISNISEKNYLGLSNTAISIGKIPYDFINSLYTGSVEVFDWYLFSRIVIYGYKGMYVKDSETIYRLHSDNYVGMRELNEENIIIERNVKIKHYQLLQKYSTVYQQLYKMYRDGVDDMNFNSNSKYYWWNLMSVQKHRSNYEN